MKRHEIRDLLSKKIDEVFAELQAQEGITEGDVHYEDEVQLNELMGHLTRIVENIIKYQKGGGEA